MRSCILLNVWKTSSFVFALSQSQSWPSPDSVQDGLDSLRADPMAQTIDWDPHDNGDTTWPTTALYDVPPTPSSYFRMATSGTSPGQLSSSIAGSHQSTYASQPPPSGSSSANISVCSKKTIIVTVALPSSSSTSKAAGSSVSDGIDLGASTTSFLRVLETNTAASPTVSSRSRSLIHHISTSILVTTTSPTSSIIVRTSRSRPSSHRFTVLTVVSQPDTTSHSLISSLRSFASHSSSAAASSVPFSTSSELSSSNTEPTSTRIVTAVHHTTSSTTKTFHVTSQSTTLLTSLKTSQVQSLKSTLAPAISGTVLSSLESIGVASSQPFNTTVIHTTFGSISPLTTGSGVISSKTSTTPAAMTSLDIFAPVDTQAPPPQVNSRADHPVPRQGIVNASGPIETNKFYANFFLGGRGQGAWTHPYSVSWAQGGGVTDSWGLAVSHVDRSMTVYGPGDPAAYFINPIGIQSIILSAQELGENTVLTMDSPLGLSADVNLAPSANTSAMITFPLVQGMGFVTGVYSNGTPLIQSSVFFRTLTFGGVVSGSATVRYAIVLQDNTNWLLYITPIVGNAPLLTLVNGTMITGPSPFHGSIQVAKNPNGVVSQAIYDASAGVYPLRGAVSGMTSSSVGNYSLSWTKGGVISRTLLMFALPHHVESLGSNYSSALKTSLQLDTTTKGVATAVVADVWTLVEDDLPYDMAFAPWSPALRSQTNLPSSAVSLLNTVAANELNEDFVAQTNLNSLYYSGKGLAKFAFTIYAVNDLAKNTGLASAGLVKLKDAFNTFVNNTQIYPIVYDEAWKGAVSIGTYLTNDSGLDFGNTYYNDHHFHYGYFVYTAAVIGYLDPTWLAEGTNKAWVNMLVRDYANPSTQDPYFPFSRSFDWYHGHSWAKGLFESGDGKDEESSSEDTFSLYAIKMWGRTIGDPNMEGRGNLQLAIQARSLSNYFLMQTTNTVQPSRFIGNRATGILFENKIDHTTYFGGNIEYIEGIHMLPLNPSSTLSRPAAFVSEEWAQYFADNATDPASNVTGGWRGVLYANLAIIDPKTAYAFFSQSGWDNSWLDGGASRTWYLAWAAALGGAS